MEEHQKELYKILGLGMGLADKSRSWAEIYAEIGRLKERAERIPPEIIKYIPSNEPMPLGNSYQQPFKCVCGNPMPHSYCATCSSTPKTNYQLTPPSRHKIGGEEWKKQHKYNLIQQIQTS